MSCAPANICSLSDEIQEQFCGKSLEVTANALFVEGMFQRFTEVYGERDHYYFQMHLTNWNWVEDHEWIQGLFVSRFVLMLPHPAHAVLLFSKEDKEVLESANAWALARRCGFDPELVNVQTVVYAMKTFWPKDEELKQCVFRGKIPLDSFHQRRSAEEWKEFSRTVLTLCCWWGQPEAPHLEGNDMKSATKALSIEEGKKAATEKERSASANDSARKDDSDEVLTKVRIFFTGRGIFNNKEKLPNMLMKFSALVTHYPNLKWRLTRILHHTAETAGIDAETIEFIRSSFGSKQYKQSWFSSHLSPRSKRRRLADPGEYQKEEDIRKKIGLALLNCLLQAH